MNKNDRMIVELSRAAIFSDVPKTADRELDWKYIYNKSTAQNIAGLLYTAVDKLDAAYKPDSELLAKWQKVMLATINATSRQYMEFQRINKLAKEKGIQLIGLKGCVIRNIYPVPELRTMGDFDILLHSNKLKKTKELFVNQGYKIENDAFGIVCHKDQFNWELFTTIGEEFRVNTDKIDNYYFGAKANYGEALSVEPTALVTHLFVHTAKHYVGNGAGIRNLLDIALFVNMYKNDIDFEKVKDMCCEQNYSRLYRYIASALHNYFNTEIENVEYMEEELTEAFVEYSLENGVFGKNDNALAVQAAKPEDDSISGFRKIFFPSVKSLKHRYKYLNTMPFLLPVAWIHRFLSALFRWKYSIRDMAKGLKEANEFSKHRMNRLDELNLKDEH